MSQKKHKLLSASASGRWTVCHAAPKREAKYPDESSDPADEGTALHEATETCLLTKCSVESLLGKVIDVEGRRSYTMTAERLDFVQDALDYFYTVYDKRLHELHVEYKFKTKLVPESGGTADVILNSLLSHTHVIDWKYGRREVLAKDNTQLRSYGFFALEHFQQGQEEIVTHIVQPRIGNYDSEQMKAKDLWEWGHDVLIPAGAACLADEPEAVPGDHCLWCKAGADCPERAEYNTQIAIHDFKDVDTTPKTIDNDTLGHFLSKFPEAEAWMKAMRTEAFRRAEAGMPPTGWKLARKNTHRKWKDEEQVARDLLDEYGQRIYSPGKIKSVAQMEKIVPKKMLEPYWVKPDGYTLVKEEDKREAISTAVEDFAGIEESEIL